MLLHSQTCRNIFRGERARKKRDWSSGSRGLKQSDGASEKELGLRDVSKAITSHLVNRNVLKRSGAVF